MKNRFFLHAVLLMAFSALFFTSCSDDDKGLNDEGALIGLPDNRIFILNEGWWGKNNSGITFYAPDREVEKIDDIYFRQNDKRLGDTGQDIIACKTDIFVTVSESKRLVKLNSAGVETMDIAVSNNPRYMVENDGKLYVTTYGTPGHVLRVNIKDLTIEDSVAVGDNPENITVLNGKLYVSNTGFGSGNTVSVIDIQSFTESEKIEVVTNPKDIISVNGDVYVVSIGAWDNGLSAYTGTAMQCISGADHSVKNLNVKASKITANDDIVYGYYQASEGLSFFTYDTKTKTLNQQNFLKLSNVPNVDKFVESNGYMLKFNPYDGDIYFGTTDYTSNGDIYRFKNDGTFIEKFESGGMNPVNAVFLK